ncbi:CbrC family protein [Actinocrinis sp.]|uniref:CbrC family protein n=1 Tax=Actinocrinis sp. TaxID=1920516 RepID=UPI0032C24A44
MPDRVTQPVEAFRPDRSRAVRFLTCSLLISFSRVAAVFSLQAELAEGSWTLDQVERYLAALDKDGQPTAHLFACRHCGARLAYSDST